MDLQADTTVVYNIVTSSAVIVGGIWAYFKFARGRTFANRAELSVSTSLGRDPGHSYLCITVALKNAGLSRLPLNNNMKAIRIFHIVGPQDDGPGKTEWKRIITLPILEQHEWLEAQETVTDSVVYRLSKCGQDNAYHGAYQIEAIVGARRRPITRKRVQWQARAVTFLTSTYSGNLPDAQVTNSPKRGGLMRRILNLGKEWQ